MIHLIILSFLLWKGVLSQTDCEFFRSRLINYTSWSESHIGTWCKDHDPASTSQCAPVTWPSHLIYPQQTSIHQHFKEWLLQEHVLPGTRKDCIARSSSLHINTTTRDNGLVEAVTCDLYRFNHHRYDECVCFPVYADKTAKVTTVVDDVYRVYPTTSVFYPPEQVVESCLLAAATQGRPTTCETRKTSCHSSVDVISRQRRSLSGFPYCATPGPLVEPPIPTPPLMPRKAKSNNLGPLPTEDPTCKHGKECDMSQCLWSFLTPFSTTTRTCVDVYWKPNLPSPLCGIRVSTVTEAHWGMFGPGTFSNAHHKSDYTKPGREELERYSTYYSAAGSPMPKSLRNQLKELPKSSDPACYDEDSCRRWCDKDRKTRIEQDSVIWIVGLVISTWAALGILWVIYGKALLSRWRQRRIFRRMGPAGGAQNVEPIDAGPCDDTEQAEEQQVPASPRTDDPDRLSQVAKGTPVFEPVQAPGLGRTAGTIGRASEEGRGILGRTSEDSRGRHRVRFENPPLARGTNQEEGVRKVSGREAPLFTTESHESVP